MYVGRILPLTSERNSEAGLEKPAEEEFACTLGVECAVPDSTSRESGISIGAAR